MTDWWVWESSSPRSVERLWRFLDPATSARFQAPGCDGRPPSQRIEDVMEAIRGPGIRYRHELAYRSDSEASQPVRPPGVVWTEREATCIDISLVAAAAMLHAGIPTWIVVAGTARQTHAWIVVDTGSGRGLSLHNANAQPLDDIDEWESLNRPPHVDEDATGLLQRGRSNDRWVPIDVSVLLRGYPDGHDRMAGSAAEAVESGVRLHSEPWDWVEVCDTSWWSRGMLVEPPRANERLRRSRARVARWLAATALVAAVVAGGAYVARPDPDDSIDAAAAAPPLEVADLRPTWVESGWGTTSLRFDPIRGLVDELSVEGEWIGPTHDGTELWAYDADTEQLRRYSADTADELDAVPMSPASARIGTLAGWNTDEDGASMVWVGAGGASVDWLAVDGERLSTATWTNRSAGLTSLVAGRADSESAHLLVRPISSSPTSLPDPTLVRLGSDGTTEAVEVSSCDSADVPLVVTSAGVTVVCGGVLVQFDVSLREAFRVDLPERSDSLEGWKFADTSMLEGDPDVAHLLLWHVTGGLIEVDLSERSVVAHRPGAGWGDRADPVGGRFLVDVWYPPSGSGDAAVVALVRRGAQRIDGSSDLRIERIGADLSSAMSSTALPAVDEVEIEWHDDRPVIVTSASGGSRLDVTAGFVDPVTGRLLGSSNPDHDTVLAPSPGGVWLMGFADRRLQWIPLGAERGAAETVWLDSSNDLGADGLPPQQGAVEYASDEMVLVSYWDDGAWHLDVIDADGGPRELTTAPGGLEVQVAGPDAESVWVRETAGEGGLWGTPVNRLRHIDVATGRPLLVFDVDVAAGAQQWVPAPDGGAVVYADNRLTRLDSQGRPTAAVDLATVTVIPDGGEPVLLAPTDDGTISGARLARFGDSIAMLWTRDSLSPSTMFVVLSDEMQPLGPARWLPDDGSALATKVLWPLNKGIAVGRQFNELAVFDGATTQRQVDRLADFRFYRGAVLARGDGEPWVWIEGPDDRPAGPPVEIDCPVSLDQLVRVGGTRFVMCPPDRTVLVVPDGSSEQRRVTY